MSIIIGIDPGISGAIACIRDGNLHHIADMPTIEIEVAGKKRSRQSPQIISNIMDLARPDHVFLEEVGSRPGEGAVGAFSFGRGFGQIEGILASMNVPYTLVRPAVWKKKLGVPADKGSARQIAMRLFPTHASSFARVKDDGRAEAALIALYGSQS